MPDWTAFGAVAGLVLALVLGLARVTTAAMTTDGDTAPSSDRSVEARSADGQPSEQLDDSPERLERRGGEAALDSDPAATDDAVTDSVANGGPVRSERIGSSAVDAGRAVDGEIDSAADWGPAANRDAARNQRRDERTRPPATADDTPGLGSISTTALLVNVVLTHGVLAAVLIGAAALTEIPAPALGVTPAPWSTGLPAVLGGVALGGALALANGALAANLDRFGIDYSDALRTALTPESALGWTMLLVVILPLVSLFEELLFRGVLVGAAATATGVSPWPFVVLSSIAFAMGHGLQGRGGILVTGSLGAVLATAFVLSESLLLVIVAHYVVNAAEFLLHEWLGVDVHERLAV